MAPARHFTSARDADIERTGESDIPLYEEGHNVADHLLEIASAALADSISTSTVARGKLDEQRATTVNHGSDEKANGTDVEALVTRNRGITGQYAATFLTQFQVLCGREWKLLRRCVIYFSTSRVTYRGHGLGTSHCSLLI